MIALKIDTKFEGKLACATKIDMRNLADFHQSTWKSPNWDLDGSLLSKVENVWALNLLGSYVSWQWRMMKNLKRDWLVSSKLTWWIWQIVAGTLKNLKNLHFNRLLLTKVNNIWAKKSIELPWQKNKSRFNRDRTCKLISN